MNYERPTWKPGDTIRSMYAVATVLGGAALDSVMNRVDTSYANRLNPPEEMEFPRAMLGSAETPVETEEQLMLF